MSQEYWEQRYQSRDMPWEKGAPSPGLVDFLASHPALPGETVCVPGCGTGHDAREWLRAGFRVYGYDIAPSGVKLAQERTEGEKLSAQFRLADFLRDEPPFQFDWLFEHTLFCAIQPDERELYVRAVLRWLKPGGNYLTVNYLIPDTDGPPFGTTHDELLARFKPHFELVEDWLPRSYPNRTGLERMFWWRKRQAENSPI
jgi:ubiquinone/menaquinone biosynthesis C-methylase UbiE